MFIPSVRRSNPLAIAAAGVFLACACVPAFGQGTATPSGSPFRFGGMPVRDVGGDQVYADQPAPSPQATASGGSAPAQSASSTRAKRPRPAPTPGPEADETFSAVGDSSAAASAPAADIGEGRFERSRFRYSVGVYEGYDSNIYLTQNDPTGSLYTMIAAGVGYSFGSSRLKLDAELSAGLTFYYEGFNVDDGLYPTIQLSLSANYAATPRLDLSFNTLTAYLSQPNYAIAGAPVNNDGDYLLSSSSFGAKYLWLPKFATETTYSPLLYYYTDDYYQDQLGRFEQTLGQQFIFLWKPTTSLVAEYRANLRTYFSNDDLNSFGNIMLLGVNHTFNPRSSMIARAGVEQRFNNSPTGGEEGYFGPFGELTFNYALGERTTVSLYGRYGTQAAGLVDVNQAQQLFFSLNVTQAITSRLSANFFFNYQNNYYSQPGEIPDYSTNVFDTGLNLNYRINRAWTLTAGYRYSGLLSGDDFSQNSYDRNIVFVGTEFDF